MRSKNDRVFLDAVDIAMYNLRDIVCNEDEAYTIVLDKEIHKIKLKLEIHLRGLKRQGC